MTGVADLVTALTGGQGIEQKAYGDAAYRIMQARNAQAEMDKRVQDAALVKDKLRVRQNFENTFTPDMSHPDALKYAILSELADQMKYGQEAVGVGQQNAARGRAAEIAGAMKGDPASLMNAQIAVAGDKLLAPTNVKVTEQADADIAKTVMDIIAGSALANERQAGAAKDRAAVARTADGTVIPDMESIPSQGGYAGMLWTDPETIPVDVPNPGFWNFGSTTQNLPLDDPRAAKKWAGMSQEEKDAMAINLGPEFMQWRTANILQDPSLQDIDIAIGKFLQTKGNPRSGKQAQEDRNKRTVYNTVADLQADIAAGVVKSGDVIQTPEGPRVVK